MTGRETQQVEDRPTMRLKAWRCDKPWHPYPCWHTKCLDCGQTISAFDFDEESSLRIAAGEPRHVCPPGTTQQQVLAV